MKKRYWASWAAAFGAVIFLAACATIPEKAAETDSLVVIKTEVSNPRGLQRGHEMVFHYSGDYKDSWVGQYSWEYNLVVVKESGAMLKSYGASLQGGFRGESTEHPLNIPLPYESGRVAIAEFVFIMKIEETGMHEYTTTTDLRLITEEEKAALMESLKQDERFATWVR